MGPGPRNTHSRLVKPDHPGLDGRVAQQRRCLLLILRENLSPILLKQIPGVGRPGIFKSLLKQLIVHLKRIHNKPDLLHIHCGTILINLLQGIGVDQRLLHRLISALLLPREHHLPVHRDPDNVGVGIPDGHHGLPALRLHRRLDEYAAGDLRHLCLHHSGGHHFLSSLVVGFRHIRQTLQPLFGYPGHSAQGRRVKVAHMAASRNPAGVRVLVHPAVQFQKDLFHVPL